MSQQILLVLRIEDSVTDPVKSIAKDALGGSQMLLYLNRLDRMSPGTNMVRPAKRKSKHGT
jgi:hypothetical protein